MQDSKSQWMQDNEDVIKAAARAHADAYKERQQYVGTVPLGAERVTSAEKARQFLPDFYTRGMAQGPIAQQYYAELIDQYGLKGMAQFHNEMTKLANDPRFWATPIDASTAAQQAQVRVARDAGQHASVPTFGGGNGPAA